MDRAAKQLCPFCNISRIRPGRPRCRACKVAAGKPPIDPEVYFIDGQACRKIPLTQGQYATVDESKYEELMRFNWNAHWAPNTKTFYAVRHVATGVRKQATVYMHGLGDHRNGDTLDNRDDNIRPANASQQGCNRKKRSDNLTGFVGVSLKRGRFIARVTLEGRTANIPGSFAEASAAGAARDLKAAEMHGEYARLNRVGV